MEEVWVCTHLINVFTCKEDFDACAMRMKDGSCFRFNKGLPCDAKKFIEATVEEPLSVTWNPDATTFEIKPKE